MNLQIQPSGRVVVAVLCLVLFACAAFAAEPTSPKQERITVNAKDRPLGEVLSAISQTTGYRFILDERWRAYPVTAYLVEAPLHSGLKRILSGLNHAIVYLPEDRIKIQIFEGHPPGTAATGRPPATPSMGSPASKPPRLSTPAPPPESPGVSSQPPGSETPESGDTESDESETDPEPKAGAETVQD